MQSSVLSPSPDESSLEAKPSISTLREGTAPLRQESYTDLVQRYEATAERLGKRIADALASLLKRLCCGPIYAIAHVSAYGTPQFQFVIDVQTSGGTAPWAVQVLEKTLVIPWTDLDLPWLRGPSEQGPRKGIASTSVNVAWALAQALRAAWVSRMHAYFTTSHENIGGSVSMDLHTGKVSLQVQGVVVENPLLGAPRLAHAHNLWEKTGRFNPGIASKDGQLQVFVREANYWVDPCSGIAFLRDPNTFQSRSESLTLSVQGSTSQEPRLTAVDDSAACGLAPDASSLEDVRLFYVHEQLYALGVLRAHKLAPNPLIQVCLAKVQWGPQGAVLHDARVIPSPKGSRVEKNWMPLYKDGVLYVVYSVHPFVIYEFDMHSGTLREPRELAAGVRGWWGGSPFVRFENGFLAVVHQKCARNNGLVYRTAFVHVSDDLRSVTASKPFSLRGAAIEFASGLALSGDQVFLGMGYDDRAAGVECLPAWQVRTLLDEGDRWSTAR